LKKKEIEKKDGKFFL